MSMDLTQLQQIVKDIEQERQLVRQILEGKVDIKKTNLKIKTVLMIVESPNKARTIANFFGKPSRRLFGNLSVYEVSLPDKLLLISSSGGHIVDLLKQKYLWGVVSGNAEDREEAGEAGDGRDAEDAGEAESKELENKEGDFYPVYEAIKQCVDSRFEMHQVVDDLFKCNKILVDKKDFIYFLQKVALEVDEVYIATDPDTEGEKIAYDIGCLIAPFNPNIYRIEYHEVTKKAIRKTIEEKRLIDENWVAAQVVRRIADRWVGFGLSQVLQKVFKGKNYSAGRVQTPVLGWVIQKDEQAKEKKALIQIDLSSLIDDLESSKGIVYKKNLTIEEENIEIAKKITSPTKIRFTFLQTTNQSVNPYPPFSTDMLLEEANKIYKFSVDYTMQLAQNLFEAGFITYHRTDSTHISTAGINVAKQYLEENGLIQYFKPRSWGEESTHEGIRPTKPLDSTDLKKMIDLQLILSNLTPNHIKLYDLIFKRFVSSQMKEIEVLQVQSKIEFINIDYNVQQELPVDVIQPGWNLILPYQVYPLKDGLEQIFDISVKFIPKVLPYTQGSLIMEMKNRGLGRPSTYANIVSTLLKRKYIIQLPKTGWLRSTKKGKIVYEFLISKYPDLVNEEFTRQLEQKMDEVEHGANRRQIVRQLFEKLKKENLINF